MLRIFTSEKSNGLRPGLNPQTWVLEDSMLSTRPPKPSCKIYTVWSIYSISVHSTCGHTPANDGTLLNYP